MGYETTLFGDGVSTTRVTNVHNHFGPRDSGGTVGNLKTEGATEQLVINFSGEMFNDVENTLVEYVLPAGAVIKAVYMDVEEVFVMTTDTSTGTLEVGTEGTEATNGFTVTEAQLEAANSVNLTSALSGTWDAEAPLAEDTTIGFALAGDNPAITDAGKARITIVYDRVNLGL